MDFKQAETRYREDPMFHRVVRVLRDMIESNQITPWEVRDAANYAAYLHQLYHPEPIPVFPPKETK